MMEKRVFRDSGDRISLLGFGAMRLPVLGGDSGKIDREKATEIVDRALAGGINYFDTAWGYHDGASEPFLGEALSRHPRERYRLASKIPPWQLQTQGDVHRIFDEQLRRCKVEYFDFYLIHSVTAGYLKTLEQLDVYRLLREKQKQGKLRHLGFSFHDTPQVLEGLVDRWEMDFAQIQLNYLDWDEQQAGRQYEILAQRGIPVVVMEPVRGGALATLSKESGEHLRAFHPGASTASWAIRFAASLPGVLTVLSGMSNLEQLADNLATVTDFKPLSEGERRVLAEAVALYRKNAAVPCTACRYCMDCPEGVDIPGMFSLYNQCKHSGNRRAFAADYAATPPKARAGSCVRCGQCVERCPQAIAIPQRMEEIDRFYQAVKG